MIEKQNKSQYVKVTILVVALIVLAFSSTYAYFASTINEPSITSATSATFEVESTLDTSSAIHNKRMVLIEKDEIPTKADSLEFTVTSKETSNVDGQLTITLTDIQISKNLKSKYFNWELLKKEQNSETLTEVAKGTFESVTEKSGTTVTSPEGTDPEKTLVALEDIKLGENPIPFKQKETTTFVFRLYLLNNPNENQISLTEGSFSGRLYLEAVPVSALKPAD